MRLFLALPLPDDVRDALHHDTAPLRAAAPAVRWVDVAKLHITVRFIGPQPDHFVPRAVHTLTQAAARTPPLALQLNQLGAFPIWRRARVIWAGLGYEPRLELLHHDLEVACMSLGLEVEGRPFRPHVTLARLEEPGGHQARAIRLAARAVRVQANFPCAQVDLMHSTPGPTGHRYVRLAAIPLGSPR